MEATSSIKPTGEGKVSEKKRRQKCSMLISVTRANVKFIIERNQRMEGKSFRGRND